jgi:hypothetical protein
VVSVRVDDVTYARLVAKAKESGLSLYKYVQSLLVEHAGVKKSGGGVEERSSIEERLKSLEERVARLERSLSALNR